MHGKKKFFFEHITDDLKAAKYSCFQLVCTIQVSLILNLKKKKCFLTTRMLQFFFSHKHCKFYKGKKNEKLSFPSFPPPNTNR